MKRFFLVSVLLLSGCAHPTGAQNGSGAGTTTTTDGEGRKRDVAATQRGLDAMKKGVDDADGEVQHALDCALGKAAPMHTSKSTPAPVLISYLRSKKFPLRLGTGKTSPRDRYMLDDQSKADFNYGVGKSLGHDAQNEWTDKYDQLEMQLEESHHVEEVDAQGLIDFNMAIMQGVGTLVAGRHKAGLELDDTDYNVIAQFLVAQHRVEQLSAISTGLTTVYHAVINDKKKDPAVIAKYAAQAQQAFPTRAQATTDDAKAYVASLKKDTAGAKDRYITWVKALHGEENFQSYKNGIDENFAKLQDLLSTEVADPATITALTNNNEDSTSPAGTGGSGSPSTSMGGAGVTVGLDKNTQKKVDTARKALGAASHGDVLGAVDATADLLPIDGRAKSAVHGVVALAHGDFKGAANAAMAMVPDGPIKQGLSLITGLFG